MTVHSKGALAGHVTCVWFDKDGAYKTGDFTNDSLERAEAPKP